jgi:ATP-binding cassette, subfamily F, member 3
MNASASSFTPQEKSVEQIANQILPDFDEDLLGYIIAVLEEMTVDERQNSEVMTEAVAPFIIDSEYASEPEAEKLCKQIIVAFGGSGYKHGKAIHDDEEDSGPELLTAPICIKEAGSHLLEDKKTYGGVVFADGEGEGGGNCNSDLDMTSMPTTTRQKKRAKKEEELLQRKLRAEAARDAEERQVMAAARMAAIRAHRVAGKKAKSGYSLERFSLPHPSGTGSLLADVSLTLASGRRYGLIGKNGSGKT